MLSNGAGREVKRGLHTAAPQPPAANAYTMPELPSWPLKLLLAMYTMSLPTLGPTSWTTPSTGVLRHSGGHCPVVWAQPDATNANSPSWDVTYTTPLSTAGDASAEVPMFPVHS